MVKKKLGKKKTPVKKAARKQPFSSDPQDSEALAPDGKPWGIRELRWMSPAEVDPNPSNWRKHPERQQQAIQSSIKANGWSDAVRYNLVTSRLWDGHARREISLSDSIDLEKYSPDGSAEIPVIVGYWREDQEHRLLRDFDPITAMAQANTQALDSLNAIVRDEMTVIAKTVEKEVEQSYERLTEEMEHYSDIASNRPTQSIFFPERAPQQKDVKWNEVEYDPQDLLEIDDTVIFPSSNPWGIPDLREDMLCEEYPTETWAGAWDTETPLSKCYFDFPRRPYPPIRAGGFQGFYNDDHLFERIWDAAPTWTKKFISEKWTGLIQPDFSIYSNWPFAMNVWSIYRARYLCRLWQEFGIKIIPQIGSNWGDERFFDIINRTIPKHAPVVICQCRTLNWGGAKNEWRRWIQTIESCLELVQPKTLVLYGGFENSINLRHFSNDLDCELVYLESQVCKRDRLRAKKREEALLDAKN